MRRPCTLVAQKSTPDAQVEAGRCPTQALLWLAWGLWLTFGIFVRPVLGRAPSQNSGSQSTCGCTKVSVNQCPEYEKLSSRVDEMLKSLADTTSLQLEIFRSKKPGEFMR